MEFLNEEKDYPKNTLIIEYPFHVGGQLKDRGFWMGTLNGEVFDYHSKENLIKQAEEMRIDWIVLKWHHHKKGEKLRKSIAQSSKKQHSKSA